jgi:diaminopimelate decarboxylase
MTLRWPEVVQAALTRYSTPFYISAWAPVKAALDELNAARGGLPLRHWLSVKTHPLPHLMRSWRQMGLGVEVVSEFEYLAALSEGFELAQILVNGVAKDGWLMSYGEPGIRVHFDSIGEVKRLKVKARDQNWKVGLRYHVSEEYDPDEPQFVGQFGMSKAEAEESLIELSSVGVTPESIHFHLRGNVRSAESYSKALSETAQLCRELQFSPVYIDFGGGLPVSGERSVDQFAEMTDFDLLALREVYDQVPVQIPSVREIWLENGRFMTARSAVLVVRILDIKDREDSRYLICDGGRTNHALVSDWEVHDVFTIPKRDGPLTLTTICGPTCMAFDRLTRTQLPANLTIGDFVVWMNAGAYHIPWETRFSHGLCPVLWYGENADFTVARRREDFRDWWRQWGAKIESGQ